MTINWMILLLKQMIQMFFDGIETDELPTTNSGDCAFAIEETIPDGQRVSGHVLLN